MSSRIATDAFGRPMNLNKLPFTTIEHHSGADYDSIYINTEGDKMEGTLDMNKNTITGHKAPTQSLDAANKAYVDNLKDKVIEELREKFKDTSTTFMRNIKKNRDQDIALKNLINQLSKKVDSDTQIKRIKSTLANTKNIPTLIIPVSYTHLTLPTILLV